MSYTAMTPAGEYPQATLPGFEHYQRYWFRKGECFAVKIKPGEFYVTRNNEAITTVLGSCVAACVRDPVVGIGGMNHFILPSVEAHSSAPLIESARYGAYAMEQLINEILKFGGRRERLEVKISGGGNMIRGMSDIGEQNVKFISEYLQYEGLKIISSDVGGIQPRSIAYLPLEGRLLVKKLATLHNDRLMEAEEKFQRKIEAETTAGDVELF